MLRLKFYFTVNFTLCARTIFSYNVMTPFYSLHNSYSLFIPWNEKTLQDIPQIIVVIELLRTIYLRIYKKSL